MEEKVAIFQAYPFEVGEKIRIEGTRRAGDWLVTAVGENEVSLRCPISGREFTWPRFCYHVADEPGGVWPRATGE